MKLILTKAELKKFGKIAWILGIHDVEHDTDDESEFIVTEKIAEEAGYFISLTDKHGDD